MSDMPYFGLKARSLLVTNWHGRKMFHLTVKIDECFRKLIRHNRRGGINDASFRALCVAWDERFLIINDFLEGIPDACRANLKKCKSLLDPGIAELHREGAKKIVVVNTSYGWQAFKLTITVDEYVRLLENGFARKLVSLAFYEDKCGQVRKTVEDLGRNVEELARIERQSRISMEK